MKTFKAGNYIQQGYYKSFQPGMINRDWTVSDMQVLQLLSQADRHLGRLDMYSEYVHIELFIQMHIAKEAVQSSKIEGTQTNIEEAFLSKEEVHSEKRNDWEEVQNYILAMKEAVQMLHRLPFSSRLIKQTHKILLQGVRGEHKMPGEYRKSQNWIGGASINDAVFVPPVHTSIDELMGDIEKFANDEANPLPDLLKVALIHYQFETIHPFLDGNGRVGRLMITLYLVSKGILKQPILYLSDFFEKHRTLYYDNLMRVRTHDDLNQWFKFFLAGIIETSKNGVKTFDGILQLQKELENKLKGIGARSGDAFKVVEYLYSKPIIDAQKVSEITGKSLKPAYNLLSVLEDLEVVKEITGAQRGRLYAFKEYIELFKHNS
ncbi:Fic family protein [Antarcticibacterium flavum]|uniref:Fic family protein n=1 Tax=Antarcticibacterium flavum TaxID=2058175 RepID=A0A5B7X1E4_9FLAO|nr:MULTISPECIES: Fic family protein [Antarcticibacterium]MCM4161296.1 cell filamentation protein Fic [Antarcticibacterium sp. W02-3]QCY69080.1 Fic family protein [Antarcticibacterium flavum]